MRAPWHSQQQQQLCLLSPADPGVRTSLAQGSESHLALFWAHGWCTHPALPRMSRPPATPQWGHRASHPVQLLPRGGCRGASSSGKRQWKEGTKFNPSWEVNTTSKAKSQGWMQKKPNSCSHSNQHSPPGQARLAPTHPRSPGDGRVAPPELPFPFELDSPHSTAPHQTKPSLRGILGCLLPCQERSRGMR